MISSIGFEVWGMIHSKWNFGFWQNEFPKNLSSHTDDFILVNLINSFQTQETPLRISLMATIWIMYENLCRMKPWHPKLKIMQTWAADYKFDHSMGPIKFC